MRFSLPFRNDCRKHGSHKIWVKHVTDYNRVVLSGCICVLCGLVSAEKQAISDNGKLTVTQTNCTYVTYVC